MITNRNGPEVLFTLTQCQPTFQPSLKQLVDLTLTLQMRVGLISDTQDALVLILFFFLQPKRQLMNQLRTSIIRQTDLVASRRRFGLFSQPPSTAIGDNSYYQPKQAIKGQDGKPKTKPRNMLAGPNRSGVGRKSYIQPTQSIYQKDPYKDPFKIELEYQKKIHGKSAIHQNDFTPASGVKTITNSPYVHIQEQQSRVKKIERDDNGRVKTEPANFLTNPTSRVEEKLFKHVKHMVDEYNRPKEIARQEREIWRSKIKGETMFRSMSQGGSFLNKDKLVFGIDDRAKMLLSQKKPFWFGNYKRANHETKFKLARRGHGDPIGRYPEFLESRARVKTQYSFMRRTSTEKSEQERETWRPSSSTLSRPTPSISLMARNLKKYI